MPVSPDGVLYVFFSYYLAGNLFIPRYVSCGSESEIYLNLEYPCRPCLRQCSALVGFTICTCAKLHYEVLFGDCHLLHAP